VTAGRIDYREFEMFHENAQEYGVAYKGPPVVRRETRRSDLGLEISALIWGSAEPELVLIHGGAQNAHTWDTVALALNKPLVAIDLPGHGHSGWREDGRYDPVTLAEEITGPLQHWAPQAQVVVGMSLGGLTAMTLAADQPHMVPSLVMVDITPGVNQTKAKAVIDFVTGPQSFASFEDLLARTIEHNPTRSESSLRRGILHNARQLDDGSWEWRYDRRGHTRSDQTRSDQTRSDQTRSEHANPEATASTTSEQISPLWEKFSAVLAPVLLIQGGVSPVVDEADIAEARRRQPQLTHIVVDGAGHSVQGDRPVELAEILKNHV
jgi:pimeloyl-ACP methyl ester carboxylesterase